jgi:SAM-dependent methyltransferase
VSEREQRLVFGEVAEQYDAMRPSYPDEMFDTVMASGGLHAGDAALEIGAGTGKATRSVLARGLVVHALEPDRDMAAVLRRTGVEVEVSTFEDWPLQTGAFKLAYAAQAWHWVGGEDRFQRLAAVLVPGGVAALFWNKGRAHPEPFATDNDEIYDRLWPEMSSSIGEGGLDWVRDGLARCFTSVENHAFTWTTSYTSAEWVQLLTTHSDHRMLPDKVRGQLHTEVAAAIDKHGGTLECTYDCQLYLGRR